MNEDGHISRTGDYPSAQLALLETSVKDDLEDSIPDQGQQIDSNPQERSHVSTGTLEQEDQATGHDQNKPLSSHESAPRKKNHRNLRVPPTSTPSVDCKMTQPLMNETPSDDDDDDTNIEPTLLLQPVTKSISQEQLRMELRSIYSGLVMVENKCKDIDREQIRLAVEEDPNCRPKLSSKQWQALIALHKALLHEFHDFFLASQHPAATPNLIKLAAQNSMPSGLWQFGIHNFLEVLRSRLPESLEYMLAFLYTAYSMMTLLYETVPAFTDIWIECLGDIGRYRMAVEDNDRQNRETWSSVSQYWYNKAWYQHPGSGRISHHLATLSAPFSFKQLSHYLRSLTSILPYDSAKNPVLSILTPVLEGHQDLSPSSSHVEILLIKLVAVMFTLRRQNDFVGLLRQWEIELIAHINRSGSAFISQGVLIMICTAAGLYEFGRSGLGGNSLSLIRRAQESHCPTTLTRDVKTGELLSSPHSPKSSTFLQKAELEPLSEEDHNLSLVNIRLASSVAFATFSIVLQSSDNVNVYSTIHEYFVMVSEFIQYEEIMSLIQADIPWVLMATFLNTVTQRTGDLGNNNIFPHSPKVDRPLPEDYGRQGLLYGQNYLPSAFLDAAGIDHVEQAIEDSSMALQRQQRILYLGRIITSVRHNVFLVFLIQPA